MSSTLHTEIIRSRQQEAAARELHTRHVREASLLARRGRIAIRRRGVSALAVLATAGLCIAIATATASAHASQPPSRVGHTATTSGLSRPHALASRAPAGRTATKSHKVNVSGYIDTVTSNGATGMPGSTETDGGIFTGTISGKSTKGAFYQNSTWGSGLMLTAKGVIFDPKGSIRFKASTKFVAGSGGTFSYTGTVTATGGTGLYRRVHGTVSTTGTTLTSDPHAATFNVTGTFKY